MKNVVVGAVSAVLFPAADEGIGIPVRGQYALHVHLAERKCQIPAFFPAGMAGQPVAPAGGKARSPMAFRVVGSAGDGPRDHQSESGEIRPGKRFPQMRLPGFALFV